ncbi:hypothetical protein JHK86_052630 [Glycine max]|nr:hypothetical protein JHK86_052630 [Glycine max]
MENEKVGDHNQDIHPSEGAKAVKAQNNASFEPVQEDLNVTGGGRTFVGYVKDSLFNTKNMQNLFNSPIFDTSVKIACGIDPLHGEPSTLSISFPHELATTKPSMVQEEVHFIHISSPQPVVEPSTRSVESRLNSMEKQVRKFCFD